MRSPCTYTVFFFFSEVLDAAKCADVVLCVVGPHASLEESWIFFHAKRSYTYFRFPSCSARSLPLTTWDIRRWRWLGFSKTGSWYPIVIHWYDMIWYDMIWYDMIWYDMIWYVFKRLLFLQIDLFWNEFAVYALWTPGIKKNCKKLKGKPVSKGTSRARNMYERIMKRRWSKNRITHRKNDSKKIELSNWGRF